MRKVILGPYDLGGLDAFDEVLNRVLNRTPGLANLPPVDVHGLFYATLIQAGATDFDVFGAPESLRSSVQSSAFLSERVRFRADGEWASAGVVRPAMERFLPDRYEVDDRYRGVTTLLSFFHNLEIAVRRGGNAVALTLPLPDLGSLHANLAPELLVPVSNFLANMAAEHIKAPLPTHTASAEDFRRLREVITSDLFARYVESHLALERTDEPFASAKKRIAQAAVRLRRLRRELLTLESLTLHLLPITSRVVNTVFGGLPGLAAEFFRDSLSKWVASKRQIVVYHFDPTLIKLLQARIEAIRAAATDPHGTG